MNEAERADRIQAWKAFLIPATLFIACLMNAAGIYMMYAGNSIGAIFLGFGFLIIVGGIFAFATFQNTKRANGQWKQVSDDFPELPGDDDSESGEVPDEDDLDAKKEHAEVR